MYKDLKINSRVRVDKGWKIGEVGKIVGLKGGLYAVMLDDDFGTYHYYRHELTGLLAENVSKLSSLDDKIKLLESEIAERQEQLDCLKNAKEILNGWR